MPDAEVRQAIRVLERHGLRVQYDLPLSATEENISHMAENLCQSEISFQVALREYRKNLKDDNDRFWEIMTVFQKMLVRYMNRRRGYYRDFQTFIERFCNCYDEAKDLDKWDIVFFTEMYIRKKEPLYLTDCAVLEFSHRLDSRSNDGWSDFVDSVPLAGREVYEKCLSFSYSNEYEMQSDIERYYKSLLDNFDYSDRTGNFLPPSQIVGGVVDFILNSENYITGYLNKRVVKSFIGQLAADIFSANSITRSVRRNYDWLWAT